MPACLPCPNDVPIPELLRLRNLAIGHDMTPFCQERYNLIGRAGHWWEEPRRQRLPALRRLPAALSPSAEDPRPAGGHPQAIKGGTRDDGCGAEARQRSCSTNRSSPVNGGNDQQRSQSDAGEAAGHATAWASHGGGFPSRLR